MKKILYGFLFVFSSIFSTQNQFYTREINVSDDYEVSQAAKLLISEKKRIYDSETKKYRDMTKVEIENELLKAKLEVIQNQGKNQHILVCVSFTDGKLKGMLYCKYGHRTSDMVEFVKYKFFDDSIWTSFWSTSFNKEVMLSMAQYAENFYRNLSMKSLVVYTHNESVREFFTAQEYRHLSKEDANAMYWTTSEHLCSFGVGLILLPFTILYLAATKDNNNSYVYYKEL